MRIARIPALPLPALLVACGLLALCSQAEALDIPGASAWAEERLLADSAAVRAEGVAALASLERDERVRLLQIALQDNSDQVRLVALRQASYSPHLSLERDVIALAAVPNRDVRIEALNALSVLATDAARRAVVVALSDPEVEIRVAALQALAGFHLRGLEAALLDALSDRDAEVVVAALDAIAAGRFFPLEVDVVAAMGDHRSEVADAAVRAAVELNTPLIRSALRHEAASDVQRAEELRSIAQASARGRWFADDDETEADEELPAVLRFAMQTYGPILDFDLSGPNALSAARRHFEDSFYNVLASGSPDQASEELAQWLVVGDPRAREVAPEFLREYDDVLEAPARYGLRVLSGDEELVCEGLAEELQAVDGEPHMVRTLNLGLVSAVGQGFVDCIDFDAFFDAVGGDGVRELFAFWRRDEPEAAARAGVWMLGREPDRAADGPQSAALAALLQDQIDVVTDVMSERYAELEASARMLLAELAAANGYALNVSGDDAAAVLARYGAAPEEERATLLGYLDAPGAERRAVAALLLQDVCADAVARALRNHAPRAASVQERRCGEPGGARMLETLRRDLEREGHPLSVQLEALSLREEPQPRRVEAATAEESRAALVAVLSSPHTLTRVLRAEAWGTRYLAGAQNNDVVALATALSRDEMERGFLSGEETHGVAPGTLVIVRRSDGVAASGRRVFVRYTDGFEEVLHTDRSGRARLSSQREPRFFALIDVWGG